ncbi:MAG: hypothetical protein KIT14_06900 [bacterium]|nr:hypothetical protein [bacterium]
MRRAFEADVLACPRCGGRMVVLATIDDPAVIARILTHLGQSLDAGDPVPERAPAVMRLPRRARVRANPPLVGGR